MSIPEVSPSRTRRRGRGRVLSLAVVAVLGIIASVLMAASFRDRERRLLEVDLDHRSHERVIAIERELDETLTHVESIAGLYAVSEKFGSAEFRTFARSILESHPGIQGFGFNPLVRAEERKAHEVAVRRHTDRHYTITEKSPDGSLIRAAERDEYVVVTYLEPVEGNEAAFGYDIASEPVRREALERARDSGRPAITGRLTLVQEKADQFGALLFVPVYAGNDPGTIERRRERLKGYAVGVIRIGHLVEEALTGLKPAGLHLRLTDESAEPGEQFLYYHHSRTSRNAATEPAAEAQEANGYSTARGLEIAGRLWGIESTPTAAFVAKHEGWSPVAALLGGLLATGMLVGYLSWQTSVNERLRRAVSERNRAEERRAGFGRVLDESHDEIYVFDAESLRFLHVNRGALRNIGYSMDELREMTPLDLKPRMNADSFAALLRPLRDGDRKKIEFATIHRRRDGSRYDVEVHLQLTDFDGVPAFVAVILDVTERKRLEGRIRQSQRLEALGTLAGGTAHDVNNLLMAIMGHAELGLAEVAPDSKVGQHLGELLRASERARDVVRQILTFSRRSPVERHPIDLRDVVGEAVRLLRGSLPKTITVLEDLSDGCRIQGDPSQIHQVIVNLCTNAAHALAGREGLLEIRTETVEIGALAAARLGDLDPGEHARITVRDNGHGIRPEIRDRIFDPFFTTKDEGEGTGMGLAVAHGIVNGHGGTIHVTSEVDRGTTFEIYLPRIESAVTEMRDTETVTGSRGERILVVDDDPAVLSVLTEMLGWSGYEVESYRSGENALEAVRERSGDFDVVVTDYSMPGMTGTNFAREFGRTSPSVPVILVSGYGDLIDPDELRECGARELLTKPIRRAELTAAITRALDLVTITNPR